MPAGSWDTAYTFVKWSFIKLSSIASFEYSICILPGSYRNLFQRFYFIEWLWWLNEFVHIKSLKQWLAHRMGLLNVSYYMTLNSSDIINPSQSNRSTLDDLGAWFHDHLAVLSCFWQLHVLFCLKFGLMGGSVCVTPESTSLLTPCLTLASLYGSVGPCVMAHPTPKVRRVGEHNLFAVCLFSHTRLKGVIMQLWPQSSFRTL